MLNTFKQAALSLAGASLLAAAVLAGAPAQASGPSPSTPPAPTAADRLMVGKQAPKGFPGKTSRSTGAQSLLAGPFFNYAVGSQSVAAPGYDGAGANFTIAKPVIHTGTDGAGTHSLAELAVRSADQQQTIEAGWTVDPVICGSADPCLFASAWVNGVFQGYSGGFVDYAPTATNLGANLSAAIGTLKTILIQFSGGNAWVAYDGQWIGYFPASMWTGATPSVTFNKGRLFQWFGEVATIVDARPCSDMGTGDQGSTGVNPTAKIVSATYYNASPAPALPSLTYSVVPSPQPSGQFSIVAASGSTRSFFYGGPGSNSTDTAVGTKGAC